MTPGGYMGQNFPTTPYAGMAMPNTPQIPSTPRGPESFMPTSPAIEPPASKESQVLAPNVEICFIPTYRSGRFKNNRAFIKEVTRDGMLEVELLQETPTGWVEAGESFTVAQTFVTPAVPALQEKRRVRITKYAIPSFLFSSLLFVYVGRTVASFLQLLSESLPLPTLLLDLGRV